MRKKPLLHVSILLYAFLLPQIVFCLFSILLSDSNSKNHYSLDLTEESKHTYFQTLSETMTTDVNLHTLQIMINNLFVGVALWAAVISIFLILFNGQKKKTKKIATTTFQVAYVALIFFFLKEGFRIGMTVVDFEHSIGLPTLITNMFLIFPHALFEFMGFIMIALFALYWLEDNSINYEGEMKLPKIWMLVLPAILICAAAVVETVVTPTLFTEYIKSLL